MGYGIKVKLIWAGLSFKELCFHPVPVQVYMRGGKDNKYEPVVFMKLRDGFKQFRIRNKQMERHNHPGKGLDNK